MSTNLNSIIVRPAFRTDLQQVLSLYHELSAVYSESSNSALSEDTIWKIVDDDPRQQLLVAEADLKVIGTITVIVIPNIGHGCRPWAAVENVVVDRSFRNKGVGSKLMEEANLICRELGCYKIVLSSHLLRQEAHKFYQRLGWSHSHIGFSIEL